MDQALEYLNTYCTKNIESILYEKNPDQHYPLFVNALDLIDHNSEFATNLFTNPNEYLSYFKESLLKIQREKVFSYKENNHCADWTVKENVHVRITDLPCVPRFTKRTISELRSKDVNLLLQISGTIIRTSAVRMLEISREYQCLDTKCMYVFTVHSDPRQENVLEKPRRCQSNRVPTCKSTRFSVVKESSKYSDYQEIKLQENVQQLSVGSIPRTISALLQNDLVDGVKPGESIIVVGQLIQRWKPTYANARCELTAVLLVNSIKMLNVQNANAHSSAEMQREFQQYWIRNQKCPMMARNHIIASICPDVYGLFAVKLAILMTLVGGSNYEHGSGLKTRGEPHMLLIGDPGTGKSQFLRFTAHLAARSVLTTGIGSTSAGLTCSAVKSDGEWMLEAGALVLADRGVCCVDEFSGIRNSDRTSIHEAMEQQTLSVAKAGLVCKLNTRTSVFAVTNPKGKYDLNEDVSVNTAIDSPLLSRFDIILVLLDDATNPEWDKHVASFVLQKATPKHTIYIPSRKQPSFHESPWTIGYLQAYIAYVKSTFQPKLSRNAIQILQKYYQLQRASDARSAARTTIRLLESLTRLSQAHARIMCRSKVIVQDAIVAITIMETSMATISMLGVHSALHSDFPYDADIEYKLQQDTILQQLQLSHLSIQ